MASGLSEFFQQTRLIVLVVTSLQTETASGGCMKRLISPAIAGLFVCAVTLTLSAQTSTTTSQAQNGPATERTITVTGCLEAAAGGATGTSGTTSTAPAGAAAADASFVLTKVRPQEGADASSTTAAPSAEKYRL